MLNAKYEKTQRNKGYLSKTIMKVPNPNFYYGPNMHEKTQRNKGYFLKEPQKPRESCKVIDSLNKHQK
jgi:hypothetical protein